MLVLSHLRWDFVFQRPQHLMTRFAKHQRVFFWEEPVFGADAAHVAVHERENGVRVLVPQLPHGLDAEGVNDALAQLLEQTLVAMGISQFVAWYYTPMALQFTKQTRKFVPQLTVYDCMDVLTGFKFAPAELPALERELATKADLMFTGGQSICDAKRADYPMHPRLFCFPSSIDRAHFAQGRTPQPLPADLEAIPQPRLTYIGVIDERMDLVLLAAIADSRTDCHVVLVGPVVKIDPNEIPQRPNIHLLGGKSYTELPQYLAHTDVALMPFALNEATKHISPTKTPEYLAAGVPVVSTAIQDVVRPYGEQGLVHIGRTYDEFCNHIAAALNQRDDRAWLQRVDTFLALNSWDLTQQAMVELMVRELQGRSSSHVISTPSATSLAA